MRAALLTGDQSSIIVLTFEHSVADGVAATYVLGDALAALNGRGRRAARVPAVRRPFDGAVPEVRGLAWDVSLTAAVVQRCRVEQATVHAAIAAAVTQVMGRLPGRDFVRVLTLICLRHLVDVDGEVATRFGVARTGFPVEQTVDLWSLARAAGVALAPARSPAGVALAPARSPAGVVAVTGVSHDMLPGLMEDVQQTLAEAVAA